MMRGIFQWLDGHPAFYWAVLAAALLGWIGRCRALGARRTVGRGAFDPVTWLVLVGVLVAGRWPELFLARGVREEEARVVLGALGLAEHARVFGEFVFEGAGPLTSALLLPTHWLGVPQDYFNLRLVALLCDMATVGGMLAILRRRYDAGVAAWAAGLLAVVLAGPWSERWAGELSLHLLLALTVAVVFVIGRADASRDEGIDFPGAVAGIIIGAMPWVHREAFGWAAGCVVVAMLVGRGDRRARWLAGAAGYSVAVTTALVWGTGTWPEFWEGYVRGFAGTRAATAWWGGLVAVVGIICVAGGIAEVAKRTDRGAKAGLAAWAVALAAIVVAVLHGTPSMVGKLAEHWRRPRTELASELRALAEPSERVALWGAASSGLVESGRRSVTSFAVSDRSDWRWQQRWFDTVRRRESAVLVVAAGERSEALRALLQDRFRLVWAGAEGEIYLRNERMHRRVMRRAGVEPIKIPDLAVADAFGGVSEIGEGRIATHAPARLVVRVPTGVRRVAGIFGFYPDAYRHPGRTTDGGRFSVAWVRERGGAREVAFERWLTPAQVPGDRGAHDFSWEVPSGVEAVEFKVESGATMSFDWGFWGELRFERETGIP